MSALGNQSFVHCCIPKVLRQGLAHSRWCSQNTVEWMNEFFIFHWLLLEKKVDIYPWLQFKSVWCCCYEAFRLPGHRTQSTMLKVYYRSNSEKALKVPSDNVLYTQVRCKEENIDPSGTKQWEEMTTRVEWEYRLWVLTFCWSSLCFHLTYF